MSFYMAQVIADERAATVARENERALAQSDRGTTGALRFAFAQRFLRTSPRRVSTQRASSSPGTPCAAAPGVAACGC